MFKKILVPSDLSKDAQIAIKTAVELARLGDGKLVLLNVRPEFMSKKEMVMMRISAHEFLKEEKDIAIAAKKILETELAEAGGSDLPHEILLREGAPEVEILEVAEAQHCDLIVITTRGRSNLREKLFGSDAEEMVEHTRVPILVIPVAAE